MSDPAAQPSDAPDAFRPTGTRGTSRLIRVSTRMARPNDHGCPTQRRAAVRPLLTAEPPAPSRWSPREEFGFGPLFALLDLVEHDKRPLDHALAELRDTRGQFGQERRSPAHPALLAWTAEAAETYLTAREQQQQANDEAGIPRTDPVRWPWRVRTSERPEPDHRGARQYEQTVWGRCYASADGSVRELWLPRFGRARKDRPAAEKAAAAQIMVTGRSNPPPDKPAPPPQTPGRARAFDFGCADGRLRSLFDWSAEEATRQFTEHAVPAFRHATDASGRRPGSDCADCKALAGCGELRRTPKFWGGSAPDRPRKRRTLSTWDLRLHAECPAQYHLVRQLNLNSLEPEHPSASRGRAVDAWLNERHGTWPTTAATTATRGCRDLPGPAQRDRWSTGGHALEGEAGRQGAAMLDEHRFLCPLDGLGPQERVLVQHRVTTYVPELDVVVLAVPDLLYTRDGGWIWRETKTSTRPLWTGRPLMRQYPQLALAVLLLAAGAEGADPVRSRVELELLTENDGWLETLDPGHPSHVAEAREVIAALAQPLLEDTAYEPRTGRHCHGCQARRWCGPGRAYVAEHRPAADGAPAGSAEPETRSQEVPDVR